MHVKINHYTLILLPVYLPYYSSTPTHVSLTHKPARFPAVQGASGNVSDGFHFKVNWLMCKSDVIRRNYSALRQFLPITHSVACNAAAGKCNTTGLFEPN